MKGGPTKERQLLSLVFDRGHRHNETLVMRPGALRLSVENHIDVRTLPSVCIANDALHDMLAKRRPFLTAKRLLSNQTFRDLFRFGNVRLPGLAADGSREMSMSLVREATRYEPAKPKARPDDCLMAAWFATLYAEKLSRELTRDRAAPKAPRPTWAAGSPS